MYCGLIRSQTVSNRFISRLYELEHDQFVLVADTKIIVIDLLPSLEPIREDNLASFLKETGRLTEYLAYTDKISHFQQTMKELLKHPLVLTTSLKEQLIGVSRGIRIYNHFIALLMKDQWYDEQPIPVVPDQFGRPTVIHDQPVVTEFKRMDLIELHIKFPDIHKLKKKTNEQYLFDVLVKGIVGLLTVLDGSVDIIETTYQRSVNQLRKSYQLVRSFTRVTSEFPTISIPEDDHDQVKVIVRSGSIKSSLEELIAVVTQLKDPEHDKLYLNRLIAIVDSLTNHFGLDPIGVIKRNHSRHLVCITNEQPLTVHYGTGTTRQVLLSGEGLEHLSRDELEDLLRFIEQSKEDRFDHLRCSLVERLRR